MQKEEERKGRRKWKRRERNKKEWGSCKWVKIINKWSIPV
jgi:hypothetical protein